MGENYSFGYWLRRQRLARDLRQADLAGQLGVAPITLRKIEADERRPSLQLIDRLAELFALSGDERAALLRVARAELSAAALPLAEHAHMAQPASDDALVGELEPASAPLPSGTVTFLFTDIAGSTQLWERHPMSMRAALSDHDALLRAAVTRHGGAVIKGTGDGVIAAFALAEDALAAALDAQRALVSAPWGETGPLQVRMAIHSGAAAPEAGDYFGPTLNRTARLLATGHGGQILLSLATAELLRDQLPASVQLRDLGGHRLKDLTRPEQILQVVAPDLPAEFPPLRTLDARRHNLPAQSTALIGREREVAELCALLRRPEVRLVTLIGPGGTGKTRLALQATAELSEMFPQGVWFVSLAPVSNPELVLPTVANVLDIRELAGRTMAETLADALREQQLLLLLDNFEQVVAAAPELAALLSAAPGVKLLVTSREALHLSGEQLVAVPPLALPDLERVVGGATSLEAVGQYEAVQLFIERARAVRADFSVTNANAPAVAAICIRLDGLPLAIELAAARVRLFTPEALLNRLERRLTLLTGGPRDRPLRQQTLRDAITWSYALLSTEEQGLFCRLGVCAGGWSISAAAAVAAGDEIEIMDQLAALADKSLLRQDAGPDGEPRFSMLETIREYALEQLEQGGELRAAGERHAAYFLAWAETAAPELRGPRKGAWCDLMETDHDNLRAALRWLDAAPDQERLARLCVAIYQFWWIRGHWREGVRWLERCRAGLPAEQRGARHSLLRAQVLAGLSWMAIGVSDFGAAEGFARESLALSEGAGEPALQADAWLGLAHAVFGLSDLPGTIAALSEAHAHYAAAGDQGNVAYTLSLIGYGKFLQGDVDAGHAAQTQALALARACGDLNTAAAALCDLGLIAAVRRDFAAAEALLEEGMALRHAVGDRHGRSTDLTYLGIVAFAQGQFARAEGLHREALELRRALGDRRGMVAVLGNLARATSAQGDLQAALRWNGESLALAREIGYLNGYHWALLTAAAIAVAAGGHVQVARLLGAAEGLRSLHGLSVDPDDWEAVEGITAAARAALAEEAFEAFLAEGRAMSLEDALALAARPLDTEPAA